MRSFKPALARDYDVFFAAIGLLCGGILFFQGWRLDPILQFGQFLLAGTTVFFAYESVRLRGIATDQARRSSYFDDETPPSQRMPGGSGGSRGGWDDSYDQFDEPMPLRRRFAGRPNISDEAEDDDMYGSRRPSRAAIPEQAASRRNRSRIDESGWDDDSPQSRRRVRFSTDDQEPVGRSPRSSFGKRRELRQDQRRGSRPLANQQTATRRTSRNTDQRETSVNRNSSVDRRGIPRGTPIRSNKAEEASFSRATSSSFSPEESQKSDKFQTPRKSTESRSPGRYSQGVRGESRDNSSRFDD